LGYDSFFSLRLSNTVLSILFFTLSPRASICERLINFLLLKNQLDVQNLPNQINQVRVYV